MTKNDTRSVLISGRHRQKIVFSIIIAALVYLAAIFFTGYERALEAFSRIGYLGWLLLLSVSFISYIIRYVRWQYYLTLTGHNLPHLLSFRYYVSAFALTTTPGKIGETIRSVLLRPHGVPYYTSLACFFVDRFLDVLVVSLLSVLVLTDFGHYSYFVTIFMIAIFAVLIILNQGFLSNTLSAWHHKHRTTRVGRFVGHAVNLLKHARELLIPKVLFVGTVLGLIAWCLQAVAFYFIIITLGLDINLATAIGIYAIALLAGAASFIPGGIGSTELVMGLLLSAMGADNTVAITTPLISRISTLWFAVVVGLIAAASINLLSSNKTET